MLRQVARDRALTEEQCRGDLTVRSAVRNQHGDAAFGRREPVGVRAAADAAKLLARLLDPAGRAERLEAGQRLLDRLPGRPLLPRSSPDHAHRVSNLRDGPQSTGGKSRVP